MRFIGPLDRHPSVYYAAVLIGRNTSIARPSVGLFVRPSASRVRLLTRGQKRRKNLN